MKFRWRSILWLLLMVVVILNAAIFFTIPSSATSGHESHAGQKDAETSSGGQGRMHGAVSHLQVLRKRLNTNLNSSSLHRHESSILDTKQERGYHRNDDSDDVVNDEVNREEEVNGDDFVHNDAVDELDSERRGHKRVGDDGNYYRRNSADISDGHHSRRSKNGHQFGSRVNYSIPEVDDFVKIFTLRYEKTAFNVGGMEISYLDFMNKLTSYRTKGPRLKSYAKGRGRRSWEKFHAGIRQGELYDPNEAYVNKLLQDMATKPIVDVEQKDGGTQIKLMMTFEDDNVALFKPMRFPRNQETLPDHFYFADYERHNAEIASFHLDRILGFNRVPPTVGRWFNISRDIQPYANAKLAKTFFISPAGNQCFHGQCSYYCDSSHPICGHPVMLEGSLAAMLPPLIMAKRKTWRNPWKRSYSKHRKAYWEVYNDLCLKVQARPPYNEGRRILDVLDISVYDFLTGNLDRHHYETYREFGNETFLLHLDQGRAFGKPKYDCISCLAPVRQCCMIRLSTLTKLVKMYQGPNSLSELMRNSMSVDPVSPILTESHLDALDRRLSKILNVINGCLKEGRTWDDVVVDDGVT